MGAQLTRVLVVLTDLEGGGAQRVMVSLLRQLPRDRFEPHLACVRLAGPLTAELPPDVPSYDFDWQHTYEFAEPRRVEKGETLHFEVTFDNSEANPYNPDPEQLVYFGLQIDEEMLIGYFEAIWD